VYSWFAIDRERERERERERGGGRERAEKARESVREASGEGEERLVVVREEIP